MSNEKLEQHLKVLRRYGMNVESGRYKCDRKSVRQFLDNWLADAYEIILQEQERVKAA